MNIPPYDESLIRYKIDFDKNKFFDEIKNKEFCKFEGPMVPQFIFPVIYGVIYMHKGLGGVWSKIIIPSKNYYGSYLVPKDEAIKLSQKLLQSMSNEKQLKRFVSLWNNAKKETLKIFAKIEKEPKKEYYLKLNDLYLWLAALRVSLDPLIAVSEDYVLPFYKKKLKMKNQEKFEEVIKVFSAPSKISWMINEKMTRTKIILNHFNEIKKGKCGKGLIKKLKEHSKKYFWITNNYKNANILDEKYFLKEIKQDIKGKTIEKISKNE